MKQSIILAICILFSLAVNSQRNVITLDKDWKFSRNDNRDAMLVNMPNCCARPFV